MTVPYRNSEPLIVNDLSERLAASPGIASSGVIKPVVKLVALPLYVLTLGLFTLVVNALMLHLTGWFSGQIGYGLTIDSFGTAVLGGLVVAVISFVLTLVVPGARKDDD